MLEIFIVLNEKDNEKDQGEGSANDSKVKEGREKRKNTTLFVLFVLFFFKSKEILGLPPKKRLFKVCSSTLTSKW